MAQFLTNDGKINNNGTLVEYDGIVFIQHLGGGFFIGNDNNLYVCEADDTVIKIEHDESKGNIGKILFVQGIGNLVLMGLQIGSYYYQLSKNNNEWKVSDTPIVSVPDIMSIVYVANDGGYYYYDLMTDRRVYYVDKNGCFSMTDVDKGTTQTLSEVCVKHFYVCGDYITIFFEDGTYLHLNDYNFPYTINEKRYPTNLLSSDAKIMCDQMVILSDGKLYYIYDEHTLGEFIECSAGQKYTNVIIVRELINDRLRIKYLIETNDNKIIVYDDFDNEYYIVSGVCLSIQQSATRQIKSARCI